MPSIQLQFYATPIETLAIFLAAMRELDVHFVATISRESGFTPILSENQLQSLWPVYQLLLTNGCPDLNCKSLVQFSDRNPGLLAIYIGSMNDGKLGLTWMGSRCEVPEFFSKWKKLVGKIKRMTCTGAVTGSPGGPKSPCNHYHFTRGAIDAQASGIRMLPLGGDMEVELPSEWPKKA